MSNLHLAKDFNIFKKVIYFRCFKTQRIKTQKYYAAQFCATTSAKSTTR